MLLFFDTETTGLYDFKLPPDHETQPYIVQLAAQLCEDSGAPIAGFSLIVAPAEFEIPTAASDVHGITTEKAAQFGCNINSALSLFVHLYQRADIIIGHNVDFDKGMIEAEVARYYKRLKPLTKPTFCTMKEATEIVGIRHDKPRREGEPPGLKWPRLGECIKFFFDEDFEGAHDAMNDLVACRRVYFALKERNAAHGKSPA